MVINIALFLVAGVHGDEISPVEAIRQSFEGLDPANMSGSVIAVFDVARPAKEFTLRKWPIAAQGDSLIDMNRMWPGKQFGN
ncbi:MAG: succinylglutamate desuccinylase/aspartoacylase family protein, partial [Thiocapsa sp.]